MFEELRSKYGEFIYDSYEVLEDDDKWTIIYTFILNEIVLKPEIVIEKKYCSNKNINREYLDYLFFQYGLFDLMNYYKLTCSKRIVIKPWYIDEKQVSFFKKILYNGLGEFFYNNKIELSYDEFVSFDIRGTKKYSGFDDSSEYSGNLIPIGGGKDSIVSLELLSEYHDDNKLFMLDRNLYPKNKAGYDSIYRAGYNDSDITIFQNNLDLEMLELNKKGYLNGHIPFSACLSMAGLIMAYLNGKKYIVLSNEASANEGNDSGSSINHQYSKSYEYERDFRNYSKEYLNSSIEYFSLLRCWNEYRIVQEFLKHKEYLSIFRSCNRGTKKNIWCNHCSKCLYVYIMLYPYLTDVEMMTVFDHDLLDDKDLEEDFVKLVADEEMKPFECVGTKLEINYSLQEAMRRKKERPYLLKLYEEKYNKVAVDKVLVEDYYNKENFIPDKYLYLVGDTSER